MATERIIKIIVQDGQVEQATQEVDKLGLSIAKVEDKSKKASKETKSAFDGVQDSASNLQGGVEGIGQEFGKVTKAAKVGGQAMRSALISTGVGALVVALGLIVDNWDKIKNLVDSTNQKIEEQLRVLALDKKATETQLKLVEKELKLSELKGEENEKLKQQRLDLIALQQSQIEQEIRLLEVQAERLKTSTLELSTREKIQASILNALSAGSGDAFLAERQKEASLEFLEIQNKINELKTQEIDLETRLFNIQNPNKPKGTTAEREDVQGVNNIDDSGVSLPLEQERELQEKRAALLQQGTETFIEEQNKQIDAEVAKIAKIAEIESRQTQIERDAAEERKQIADIEAEQKQMLLGAVSDSLVSAGSILGEQTAAGKALAVAGALINTYSAIAGQLKAFSGIPIPGYAIAQSIATGLAGFAAVKKILSVKVPGGGGGGNVSTGSPQRNAPSFNVVGTSGTNQLAQSLQQQNEPIEAFVVASNVSGAQAVNRNIVETSTLFG